MKITYLGTAAAEGIPAIFCNCPACTEAREKKGRHVRTRSQALINNDLLIDFPADTYMHLLQNDLNMHNIRHCLITHNHSDHFYAKDLEFIRKGYGNYKEKTGRPFMLYGTPCVCQEAAYALLAAKPNEELQFEIIYENTPFMADNYKITPLKAVHSPVSDPVIYLIEQDGKAILYAHDTDYLDIEVWDYLTQNKIRLDLVSLDCTEANREKMPYVGHMNLSANIRVKEEMLKLGIANENTIFICNHFSHNGIDVSYDNFKAIAEKHGFLVSFDGMTVEI